MPRWPELGQAAWPWPCRPRTMSRFLKPPFLCLVEECPPKMRWTAAASLKDSSEGCSSPPSPNSGVLARRCFGVHLHARLRLVPWGTGCSWLLRGCSAPRLHPEPSKSPATEGLCHVPQPTKPGTVSAGGGETHRVPTRRQAACQPISPASALSESPARYSLHKGPIFLQFCRAAVTGSDSAAPGAPTPKPGPWTKNPHCHEPFSFSCMNGKHSFYMARKREGGCTNPAGNAPTTAAMKCKEVQGDAGLGGAKPQPPAP